MSMPPSWVSPEVDTTSNTPSPISIKVTSNVPRQVEDGDLPLAFLVQAYAEAAASLVHEPQDLEARDLPRVLRACRWLSLKYAGTVMTTCAIFSPRWASASVLIFRRMTRRFLGV